MTKEEIKKVAEEMIEAQCDESGCCREEVLEVSTLCFLEKYIHMEEVEKLKEKRKKQAVYRSNHKARKLIERKEMK